MSLISASKRGIIKCWLCCRKARYEGFSYDQTIGVIVLLVTCVSLGYELFLGFGLLDYT